MARVNDNCQAYTARQVLNHAGVQLVINYVTCTLVVDRINHAVEPRVLRAVLIFNLAAMPAVMKKQRIPTLCTAYQPPDSVQYILARWVVHRILLVIRQRQHCHLTLLVLISETPKLMQMLTHVPDIIATSLQLSLLTEIVAPDQERLLPALARTVLEILV